MSNRVHTVKKGDTLWGISRHYDVDMQQLIAMNNLRGSKPHHLQIGQEVNLPDDADEPDTELSLRIFDLSSRPISRAKLKLEYDGKSVEVVGDAQGEVGPIYIGDHAKGIKVHFRGLDGNYVLIADHKSLPMGCKRLTLTSRKMLMRGNYLYQEGAQRTSIHDVRRDVKRINPDPHIKPGQASGLGAGTTAAPSAARAPKSPLPKPASTPLPQESGLLNKAPPTPVLIQTRIEGGQPTQIVGALFAEENLKLVPANEKYRKILIDVARRRGMTPHTLAAVINAEAAKDQKTGEWLANSKASTSSAAGLTQFLEDSWLELATDKRSLVNQKLKREHGYEQINAEYGQNLKGKRYLDYIYGKIGKEKHKISRSSVLPLRFDPEHSIDAGALYAIKNLETMNRLGVGSSGLAPEDLAKLMYLAHHEGAGGAIEVIKGTLTEERAKELLPRQVPSEKKRRTLLGRFDNNYKKTYIHWLFTYTDSMIDVRDFMVKPGTLTPKTTSQLAIAVNGAPAKKPKAKPTAKPATPRPVQPNSSTIASPSHDASAPGASSGLNAVGWRNPLDSNRIRSAGLASWRSATFGMVRDGGKNAHQGVDLIALPGTPVYAVGNGTVVSVYKGFSDTENFGATVVLCVDVNDLPEAQKRSYLSKRPTDKVVYFAYCHLSKIDVAVRGGGTPVKIGAKLGETGESGNAKGMNTVARGAHLHFEVRYQHPLPRCRTGLKYRVDPRPFLLNVSDPS